MKKYLRLLAITLAMVLALGFASFSYADTGDLKAEQVDLTGEEFVSDAVKVTEGKYKPGDLGLVLKKDKIGFIDSTGTEVIPCQFGNDTLTTFNENGLATAIKDGKYGIINTSGEEVVPFIYDSIDSEFGDQVYVSASRNGKYGYISLTGKKGIPFSFDEAVSFGNAEYQYGIVTVKDKSGLINSEGTIVLPIQYDYVEIDQGGYVLVTHNEKQGMLGPDLAEIMPVDFDSIDVVPSGDSYIVCATKGGKSFIYNTEGKQLADCGETFLDYPYEGSSTGILAALHSESDAGLNDEYDAESVEVYTLYNSSGRQISDERYIWYEIAGNAVAAQNEKGCGMLDAEGKVLVPFEYDNMEVITNSKDPVCMAYYKEGQGWSVFDDTGKAVADLSWIKLTASGDSEIQLIGDGRYYISDEEVAYGPAVGDLYDASGNKLNQGKVKVVSWQQIGSTIVAVDENGKYGVMDLNGNLTVPCEYAGIECSAHRLGDFYFAYQSESEEDSDAAEQVSYINSAGQKVTGQDYTDPWDAFLVKFTD